MRFRLEGRTVALVLCGVVLAVVLGTVAGSRAVIRRHGHRRGPGDGTGPGGHRPTRRTDSQAQSAAQGARPRAAGGRPSGMGRIREVAGLVLGKREVPWRAVASALLTSVTVAAPLAIAAAMGDPVAGGALTLGAYLWTISHMSNPRPLGPQVAAFTTVALGLAAGAGFAAGGSLWLLVVMCGAWAVFQAVGEVAGGPLRMTAAMSTLCVLLSSMEGRASAPNALKFGILVAAGAAWEALVDLIRHPPFGSRAGGTRALALGRLTGAWPKSRAYSALLAGTTMVAAATAGAIRISHGAWMAAAALRVLRPESTATLPRARQRVLGTAGGAAVAAGLLAAPTHDPVAVVVVVVAVAAMQLIGPRRYGPWTFCLTLVALALNSAGHPGDLDLGGIRLILTVAGTGLAVASILAYEKGTRWWQQRRADAPR